MAGLEVDGALDGLKGSGSISVLGANRGEQVKVSGGGCEGGGFSSQGHGVGGSSAGAKVELGQGAIPFGPLGSQGLDRSEAALGGVDVLQTVVEATKNERIEGLGRLRRRQLFEGGDAFGEGLPAQEVRFQGGPVPRPPRWSGWRVTPDVIEFWQDRDNRLHERTLYTRSGESWTTSFLYP